MAWVEPVLHGLPAVPVERPPEVWEVTASLSALQRVVAELLAAAVARAGDASSVVLRVNNVTVEPDPDPGEPPAAPAAGDYAALTVLGPGDWGPELAWVPDRAGCPTLLHPALDDAARAAGVRFAYTRRHPSGSLTVLVPRADG